MTRLELLLRHGTADLAVVRNKIESKRRRAWSISEFAFINRMILQDRIANRYGRTPPVSSLPISQARRRELDAERETSVSVPSSTPRTGDLIYIEHTKRNGLILWINSEHAYAFVRFFKTKEAREDHTELSLDDLKQFYINGKGRKVWTIEG